VSDVAFPTGQPELGNDYGGGEAIVGGCRTETRVRSAKLACPNLSSPVPCSLLPKYLLWDAKTVPRPKNGS